MRTRSLLISPVLLALACGGKGGGGSSAESAEEESSESSGDTGDEGADETSDSSDETTEESSDTTEESTETGPTSVNLSGTVQDFFVMGPVAGAEISVRDRPEYDQVSGEMGEFEFLDMPLDSDELVLIAESESYWGAVIPLATGTEDDDEVDLAQVSVDVINIQEGLLQDDDPTVMVDREKAAIIVAVRQNTATDDGPPVVTMTPPPAMNAWYAPDASGDPVLNTGSIEWPLYPVAVFFNLDPADEGTYSFEVEHPVRDCTVIYPEPLTVGRSITLVEVDCPPPG